MRGLMAVCCLLFLGCASFRDAFDQDFLYLKMCAGAERAWREHRPPSWSTSQFPKDFEQGFMDGYVAVGFGANGCPPTVPSRDYWGPKFKNDVGKARILAWYNGYAAGAGAAQSVGLQDRNRIPTANEMFGQTPMKSESLGTTPMVPTHDPLPSIPDRTLPPDTPPAIAPEPSLTVPLPAMKSESPQTVSPPAALQSWRPTRSAVVISEPAVTDAVNLGLSSPTR